MTCKTPATLRQNTADPTAKWLVQKYGGTSVGKFAVTIAEEIVPTYLDDHKLAIVCSARSGSTKATGTTNLLLRAASEALHRKDTSPNAGSAMAQTPSMTAGIAHSKGFWSHNGSTGNSVNGVASVTGSSPFTPLGTASFFQNIQGSSVASSIGLQPFHTTLETLQLDHLMAARANVRDPDLLKELEAEIDRDCEGLRSFLFAAQIIDEISPRSRDCIVGIGERLSCKLIAATLRDRGVDAEFVSLENILPVGESSADAESSIGETGTLDQSFYDGVAEAVGQRIEQCGSRIPVVTGFFGPVPGSLLQKVGRGYTDLLAALAAVGLEASELQIWKEVDGIFTADPRKVSSARLISIISPDEAAELTYYGSEVVHPFTMEQVFRKKIPIRIKNVENALGGGTVIHPDADSDSTYLLDSDAYVPKVEGRRKSPTAVAIKEHVSVLNVHSNQKSVSHGFLTRILGTFDRYGIDVDLVSTSEVHVSMAFEDGLGKRVMKRLVRELQKNGTVTVQPDMAILSLVGMQMRNVVGIAARMFSTLARGNVNIEMISQGASEINVSCVIDERDAVKALNLIHQSCLLNGLPVGDLSSNTPTHNIPAADYPDV